MKVSSNEKLYVHVPTTKKKRKEPCLNNTIRSCYKLWSGSLWPVLECIGKQKLQDLRIVKGHRSEYGEKVRVLKS